MASDPAILALARALGRRAARMAGTRLWGDPDQPRPIIAGLPKAAAAR